MPWLRHKAWAEDGLPAHTVTLGLDQFSFLDKDRGLLLVPHRDTARSLLNRYPGLEIAWDQYGVTFTSDGREVVREPPPPEPGPVEVESVRRRGRRV